jgi:Wzt C-terminal domain
MARLTNPIVGLEVYDRFRTLVTSFHTVLLKVDLPSLEAGETLAVEFRFRWLELRAGNYVFEPAIADGTPEGHEMLDWVQCPLSLQTTVRHPTDGLVRIPNIQTQYEIA